MKRLIKDLSQYLNNLKIRKQLLLTYLLAVLLPVLLLGIYLVSNTRNLVLQQQISEAKSENIKAQNSLDQLNEMAYNISNIIYFDKDIRSIISKKYQNVMEFRDDTDQYMQFNTFVQYYPEIKNIEIYAENETFFDSPHFLSADEKIQKSEWFKKATSSSRLIWAMVTGQDGFQYLSLIRQLSTFDPDEKAVMVINISRNYLQNLVKDDPLKTMAATQDGTVFLSNSLSDFDEKIPYAVPPRSVHEVRQIQINNEKVIGVVHIQELDTTADTFSLITINENALKKANDVTFICMLILLLSMVVPFFIIQYFSGLFSRRINLLRAEMSRAASGNLDRPLSPGGNDEISELYSDLNVMIDGIKNLLSEVYMEKLMKERMINSQQKIEFKMLASQINPHFLYNTLETIRMKLICSGDRETANVIKVLGKTIRRMLEVKDEVVTLSSELEYIRYYLEIQRFRFGSRIEYEICVADSVDAGEYYLLPLLLQPIVENAFVHGLEDKEGGGKIDIRIERVDAALRIVVEDNGNGIPQQRCAALNEAIRDMENSSIKNSIGLCNVHHRIALYYGSRYGLTLTSREGAGTRVVINLPADGEGMIDYESTDH